MEGRGEERRKWWGKIGRERERESSLQEHN